MVTVGFCNPVALLTESVDRNAKSRFSVNADYLVALLTESVDRNPLLFDQVLGAHVALLTESVDRNTIVQKLRRAV